MKQFDLSFWIQDKTRKICTRDGRPVRIVCWDSPNKGFPIVGFIDDNPTVFVWDKYGYALSGHRESNCDLFFADEEDFIDSLPEESASEDLEEDSSFEKLLQEIYVKYDKKISIESLLDIAHHFTHWQHGKDFDDLLQSEMKFPKEFYEKGRSDMREEMLKDTVLETNNE